MTIDVILTPDAFHQEDMDEKVVVVVDVLRASTTIITALFNGAKAVLPFRTVSDAKEKARTFGKGKALLCGEREGRRIPGFQLGNSPAEYEAKRVRDHTLLFTSTNGSQMLARAERAARIIVGGFVNMAAVTEVLIRDRRDCVIACSGRQGDFSIEDVVCAGMIVSRVKERLTSEQIEQTDSAGAAEILYHHYRHDLERMVRESFHGRYLTGLDMADDLAFCAAVDRFPLVPVLTNRGLVTTLQGQKDGE